MWTPSKGGCVADNICNQEAGDFWGLDIHKQIEQLVTNEIKRITAVYTGPSEVVTVLNLTMMKATKISAAWKIYFTYIKLMSENL